jgi:hypothetical protein
VTLTPLRSSVVNLEGWWPLRLALILLVLCSPLGLPAQAALLVTPTPCAVYYNVPPDIMHTDGKGMPRCSTTPLAPCQKWDGTFVTSSAYLIQRGFVHVMPTGWPECWITGRPF